jgi:hypothetical protein
MKFSHLGIPTNERFEGEIDLPHLKMKVSDHGITHTAFNGCAFEKVRHIQS